MPSAERRQTTSLRGEGRKYAKEGTRGKQGTRLGGETSTDDHIRGSSLSAAVACISATTHHFFYKKEFAGAVFTPSSTSAALLCRLLKLDSAIPQALSTVIPACYAASLVDPQVFGFSTSYCDSCTVCGTIGEGNFRQTNIVVPASGNPFNMANIPQLISSHPPPLGGMQHGKHMFQLKC